MEMPETLRDSLLFSGARQDDLHPSEFASLFPGCEVGSMPPFGNLWQIPVYADESLAEDEVISFSAGGHGEIVSLAIADFQRLVQPQMISFGRR